MFMQFLQTQASVQASQVPNIKLKYTLDLEIFPGEGSSIEQIHEYLETLGISLNLKMILNLDCMPTLEACITYTFSRISRTSQGCIASKIQAKYYQD